MDVLRLGELGSFMLFSVLGVFLIMLGLDWPNEGAVVQNLGQTGGETLAAAGVLLQGL